MSAFIRSTQVTNSPRSCGRAGSRTRWIATPAASSSGGDSSPPLVSTCTSVPSSARLSESLRTCRASPPSIRGGYSQERISARVKSAPGRELDLGLEQGRESEVGGEVAHAWIRRRAGVYGLEQALSVAYGAAVRVVAGLAPGVQEGPIARLKREQLAGGPLGGRSVKPPGAEGRQQAQLEPPGAPGQVRDPGRVPGSQVLALAPARRAQATIIALVAGGGLRERDRPDAALGGEAEDRLQPGWSLRPPVSEQLRVDREREQARPTPRGAEPAESSGDMVDESRGVLLGTASGGLGVVGPAADRPQPDPVRRQPVELEVGAVGRISMRRPHQRGGLPVDCEAERAGAGPRRPKRRRRGVVSALVGAEEGQPVLGEQGLETGLVGALGKPQAADRTEPPAVRAQTGVDLEAATGDGRDQRHDGMGGGGGHQG